MQIEINKEVSDYKETVFFGLTLRQCVCSVLAIVVAVVLYFVLKPYLGSELLSWVCMLGAAPFAAMGFGNQRSGSSNQRPAAAAPAAQMPVAQAPAGQMPAGPNPGSR